MPYNLNNKLVIAISSRVLFDLSDLKEDKENKFAPISKREQKFINGIKKLLK